MKGALFFSF